MAIHGGGRLSWTRKGKTMAEFFEDGYAVVIGAGGDLPITVEDANAVNGLLRDPSVCAYPPKQVYPLVERQATRTQIIDALKWLANAPSTATAFVYFSGHGMELPDFHIMPFGYDVRKLDATAISGREFTDLLQGISTQKLVVVLDCCHAGGQADPTAKSPISKPVLQELSEGSGRVVLASSKRDEVSWTGKPFSVFTTALLEGFHGQGSFEDDGYARILDIALWVARKVPERTGDKQHPTIKVSNLKDNFALAWYAGGAKRKNQGLGAVPPARKTSLRQIESWKRRLANFQENLLLVEERISEYPLAVDIPLLLVKQKSALIENITEMEKNLGDRQ
jgi:hypothetical protein